MNAGSTSFQSIYEGSEKMGLSLINPVYLLVLASMLIVIIAETARIPVDDPATHLELTMVHEAMVLEYSGRQLALIEYASSLKQLLFITLVVNIFLPFGAGAVSAAGIAAALLLYLVKVLAITFVIGLIEINTVKLRIFSVPNLAALAFILSILGFMSGFVIGR
jgi:formate hydrogenlyase subunit 4